MNSFRSLAAAALALTTATAALVPAQTDARILGLTATNSAVQSQDFNTCMARRCQAVGFPTPVQPWAGGTAYDTRTRGTWITNGIRVAKVDSRSNNACDYQCPPQNLPFVSLNIVATGLAYRHSDNTLWVTDSNNRVSIYAIGGCGLNLLSQCTIPLPLGQILTGVALDDVDRRVFYTASSFSGPVLFGGRVLLARQQDPCNIICGAPVTTCAPGQPMSQLTGIGFDACENEIWVTDGNQSVAAILTASCQLVVTGCCINPSTNDPYVGLCVEPATEASNGMPCTNGGCPNCNPRHFLGSGDPVVGNAGFTLDGGQLPANTFAAILFNVGPCSAAGPTIIPFCGELLVNLSPTLLAFSTFATGTTGCTGTVSLNASIPADTGLCGFVFSSQILGVCLPSTGTALGTYVSNCLSWQVSAS